MVKTIGSDLFLMAKAFRIARSDDDLYDD